MGFIIQIYSKNHGGFIWVKPVIFVPLNQFQDRNFQVTSTAAFWTPEIKGPLRWPGVCAQSQFPTATWIAGGQGHLGLQAETPEEFHMIVFTNGSNLDSLLFGQISSMLRLFPSKVVLDTQFLPSSRDTLHPCFVMGIRVSTTFSLYGKIVTDGSSTSAVYLVIYTLLRGETSKFLCVNARPIFCEIWGPNVSLSCWWNCNFGNPMRYLCKGT